MAERTRALIHVWISVFHAKNIKISEINSKDNQIGVLYHCVRNRIGDEITSASKHWYTGSKILTWKEDIFKKALPIQEKSKGFEGEIHKPIWYKKNKTSL